MTSVWLHTCPSRLPTSEGIITALRKIVKVFEDTIQVQLIKEGWEEIKNLRPALTSSNKFISLNTQIAV